MQIIDSLVVGGAEVLAVNIANELSEQGIESHFCTTRKEGDLKKNISPKVNYLFLNRKKTIDIKAIFKLKKYIKQNKIDIIHAHTTSSFIAFCIKLLYPKVKFIWHNHTGAYVNLKGKKLFFLKMYSKYIDCIINVNKELDIWAKNTLNHKNSYYLQNFAVFSDLSQKTTLFGENGKRIVCLAGLREVKDHLNLLRAFHIFNKDFKDWSLHLIGKEYDDSYSKQIREYITDNSLTEKVFLYGLCTDIKYILSQSRIGVLSSKHEGLPISLLEYGLANLPVLITNVGESKEVIKNNFAIVEPNNSLSFAKKLSKIVTNEEIEHSIIKELNKNVLSVFSKKESIIKLKNIYKNLC